MRPLCGQVRSSNSKERKGGKPVPRKSGERPRRLPPRSSLFGRLLEMFHGQKCCAPKKNQSVVSGCTDYQFGSYLEGTLMSLSNEALLTIVTTELFP